MKQVFAIALLFLFSFTLTAPLFAGIPADAGRESKLPACCRRDGKHHCQKTDALSKAGHAAPAVRVEGARCSQYPPAPSSAASNKVVFGPGFRVEATLLPVFFSIFRESRTQHRAPHGRNRQKRGPPFQV